MPLQTMNITGTNGDSSLHDLLAMTDEQILEMPDGTVASGPSQALRVDEWPFDEAQGERVVSEKTEADAATTQASAGQDAPERVDRREVNERNPKNAGRESRGVGQSFSEPPKWLAEMMADPQAGGEARDLWNGTQRAQIDAAAYREVFAKPEDARAAAERARQLETIDRAYYTGDVNERARLAATMLRDDPAAFREMVEVGLKLLQDVTEAPKHGEKSLGKAFQENRVSDTRKPDEGSFVGARHAVPSPGNHSDGEAQLAAYATFERAANEDLERSVGGAIARTLEQALPNLGRNSTSGQAGAQHAAPLQGKLAAAVRQDVEAALQGDRQLGEQVSQILSARRFDNASRAQIVRLISERAQQLVPGATKRVLHEWTQTTLSAHRGRTEQSNPVSSRREVTPASSSGAAQRGQQGQPTKRTAAQAKRQAGDTHESGKMNYRKLSDEDILDL